MKPTMDGSVTVGDEQEETLYDVFVRDWWRPAGKGDAGWPGGRVPCPGERTYLAESVTWTEARAMCAEYNDSHDPGPMSRKAEFESR